MNAENTKLIGLTAILGGIFALALSAYGAYAFPNSSVPPNSDLTTLLTIGWQRLVLYISLAIVGILGILAGTTLYGFGRLIDEVTYLQYLQESEKIEKKPE